MAGRRLWRAVLVGVITAYAGGYVLHRLHAGLHETHDVNPALHWLRDSSLALPSTILVVVVATVVARGIVLELGFAGHRGWMRLTWALVAAVGYALASVPGNIAHAWLFGAEHEGQGALEHATNDASAALGATLVILLVLAWLLGTPGEGRTPLLRVAADVRTRGARASVSHAWTAVLRGRGARVVPALLPAVIVIAFAAALAPRIGPAGAATSVETGCAGFAGTRTIEADVVALEQPFFYNRLGVRAGAPEDPYGLMYALRRDVVVKGTTTPIPSDPDDAKEFAGQVELRPGKRPRPLALRMNVGDCLVVHFQNLLGASPKPDHPGDRHVGVHVNGLQIAKVGALSGIGSDGSFVGENESSLVGPGGHHDYALFAEYENTYLMYSMGTPVGGEGLNASIALGLFGAINVEPWGTQWYRSQVTRADMDLASTTVGDASTGQQPVLDYEALYPTGSSYPDGTPVPDGTPILNMLQDNEIVHADLNAVVTGAAKNGYRIERQAYPDAYWANQNYNQFRDRGAEPFREFTVIFHDEIKAIQAFKETFEDETLEHTLHGVRDGFAINYGTGGIGAEILANRAGVGPMGKCVDCKYEEFFLSSWAVGDPAMVLDTPTYDWRTGTAALHHDAKVPFPDDPANVHHSYLNDRVKFRNLHAGPKEHHIFHLHAHQWQYDWNEKTSAYLDSQNIGPGGGFTYEIANGGSGNRNKTAGDSIFHCHFYPHFAQGMWELWRVHDTFEQGTLLDADGRPDLANGARAFPDGEIVSGTPIPGVVPLPGLPRAPMPNAATTVVPYDLDRDGVADSSQIDVDGNGQADLTERDPVTGEAFAIAQPASNPGYPFFVPGIAGHRAPTPPLDIAIDAETEKPIDGGLARHVIVDGTAVSSQTRLDMNKELTTASVVYLPEKGTPAERAAMDFHSSTGGAFEVNGLEPVAGAPFADPCRPDNRPTGWTDPVTLARTSAPAQIGRPRTYKAAVIELDATLNKLGWHFPQQRILSLNQDVDDALAGRRAPEPLVMRLNVGDCATYEHTNLVPNTYKLDDYQVTTPTDIIGQHIHLVKFDVLAADGSANGFNYEDGTLSPQEVEERIHAIRAQTGTCDNDTSTSTGVARLDSGETPTPECPLAVEHPTFGSVAAVGDLAWGARTTIQRWYVDPVLNGSWDKGLGTVFTHDHYGPSTHQQVGLYATVLIEPESSKWFLSRPAADGSRVEMGSRPDGGPTSWRADVVTSDAANSYREFYLEYSDFQHAYEKGGGVDGSGRPVPDFDDVVNPSFRLEPPSGSKTDLYWFPPNCPGGNPRPCPEAISADDPGTYVVNYRNEPLAARVYDPSGKTQASGERGDLARAFESRTDRKWAPLNSQPGVYPPLTPDVQPGDPYTPLLPVYQGDKVRLRVQVGGQEEEHIFTMHGLKWQHEPRNANSGWRSAGPTGISEYFNLETPVVPDLATGQSNKSVDYLWEAGAQTEDRWNGAWGLLRSYGKRRTDLNPLPNNTIPAAGWTVSNLSDFTQSCPKKTGGAQTPTRRFAVTALRAEKVLGDNGLVYNDRGGKLVDPNALIYVMSNHVLRDKDGVITGLAPGTPIEPIVLRAAAGDCIRVDLENALPTTIEDHNGFNALPPIIRKSSVGGGFTTFNANDIRPSNRVGLVPQLVAHDVGRSGGLQVGGNPWTATVGPGETKQLTWFAGELGFVPDGPGKLKIVAKPIEYGAVNLMAADPIKGASKGLVGALVIEPPGATWTTDPNTRVSATVSFPDGASTRSFREFVTVLQDDLNLRRGGCSGGWDDCAIPSITGGEPVADPQDTGQKAINYGADPLWHRLGIAANTPFETILANTNVHKVFSNSLVGGDDPQTAVFAASPEAAPVPMRMRLVQPGGHARGHELTVHGHAWQRQPYIEGSDRLNRDFHADPTNLSGPMDGHNMTSWWISSQEGMGPSLHYDLLFKERGGEFGTRGDYLFRDFGSFGTFGGLWGILRVNTTPAMARVDSYVSPPRSVATDPGLTVGASSGVKANDLDLDRDPLPPANVVSGPAHGSLELSDDGSFTYKPDLGFVGTDRFTYRLGSAGGSSAVVQIGVRSAPPSAANDYVAVAAGSSSAIIPVLANDADPDDAIELVLTDDGESVQVERVRGTTAKGYVTPYGAQSVLYTPFAGATGSDSFKYTVEDETGNRTTGTVFVTISTSGEGATTVSSVVWEKKAARWTIEGTAGTLEDPKTATITARLGGTKTIGSTSVAANPEGTSWKVGPTGTSPPKSCGDKVTVTSSLGTTVANVPVTCR